MSDEELAAWCEAQACRSQREDWDETMRAIAAALRRPAPAPATQAMYDAGAQALFDDAYGGSSGLDDMLADVCRDNAKLAIDAALAASPPAPTGWRPIDFMAVKQCSECSSQLCATAHGMTGVIVVFDNQAAAEAYQRAMLAAVASPPAHAELAARLRDAAVSIGNPAWPRDLLLEAATALGDT